MTMDIFKKILGAGLMLITGVASHSARADGPALEKMTGEVVFGFEQRIFDDEVTHKEYWVKATPDNQPFAGEADGKGVRYEVEAEVLGGNKDGYGHLGKWKQAINIKSWKLLGAKGEKKAKSKKDSGKKILDINETNKK